MSSIKSLIIKAFEQKKLRYAPEKLDFDRKELNLELNRTGMSGVEFGYSPENDQILWATQTIDGVDIHPRAFVKELAEAVGEDSIIYLVDTETSEVALLEAAFEEQGGRGVELAEAIDALRAELATSNFGSEGIHDDEFPNEHSHDPEFELEDEGTRTGVFATDDEGRHYWLEVKTTSEGLIIDVWDRYGEEPLATFARTFDELVDFVFANNPVNEQPCQHYAAKSASHERPRWLVIEKTLVSADTRDEAIDAAVNCLKGYDQEVELQDAVLVIESDETDGKAR
jgi:hypothetical protein